MPMPLIRYAFDAAAYNDAVTVRDISPSALFILFRYAIAAPRVA